MSINLNRYFLWGWVQCLNLDNLGCFSGMVSMNLAGSMPRDLSDEFQRRVKKPYRYSVKSIIRMVLYVLNSARMYGIMEAGYLLSVNWKSTGW